MQDSLFIDVCKMNYEALFKMIHECIKLCPDELWNVRTEEPPFWQQAYHTIFYTDFYLSETHEGFKKPSFADPKATNLKEIIDEAPSRDQILDYLKEVKNRGISKLSRLSVEQLEGNNPFHWTGPTPAHRLVYNIRHSQHHVGWMNSILARKTGKSANWAI